MATDREVIDRYLAWALNRRQLARTTITNYRGELEKLSRFAAARRLGSIDELTEDDLLAYFYEIRDRAPATLGRIGTAFRGFYDYLVQSGARSDDPAEVLPRHSWRRPRRSSSAGRIGHKLSQLDEETRLAAQFIREVGDSMGIAEACTINEQTPVPTAVRVTDGRGIEREVVLTETARSTLDALDGHLPKTWTLQRKFRKVGLNPKDLKRASRSSMSIDLHPDLEEALHRQLADGELVAAARHAFIAVERRLRDLLEAEGGSEAAYGRDAVDWAFGPNGLLAAGVDDQKALSGLRSLLSGALGYFRNQLSHELVRYKDPMFAREVIIQADLLLRLLDDVARALTARKKN